MKNLIYIIFISPILSFLWKNSLQFTKKEYTKNIEISKNINYDKNNNNNKIIKNINGFYGLIGPDKNINKTKTLYELFMGNGVINGIFFDNGNITYVKKYIKTDKYLHEDLFLKLDVKNIFKYQFQQNRNIFYPNILGVANTNLLEINRNIYALHERDKPYLLNINFTSLDISTIKKINIKNLNHFSAHSKFINNIIETIDYKVFSKTINYYQLTNTFENIIKKKIKTKYLPLIHDFITTDNNIIIFDSPIKINLMNIISNINIIPLTLDPNKPTYIYIMNKKNNYKIDTYYINISFYIFHFADYYEDDKFIEIYTSVYEKFDLSTLKLDGKYRKILINKLTKRITIEQNVELEKMNLDFPIKYNDKVILQSSTNEFVICKKLNIIKKIKIPTGIINGEHNLIYIDKIPHLICFTSSTLLIINIISDKIIEIPINEDLNIGFHSIYIENNK